MKDKKAKSNSLRILTILYVVFFVIIAAGFIFSFGRGVAVGWNDAQMMVGEDAGNRKVDIFYDVNVMPEEGGFGEVIRDDETLVKVRVSRLDAKLSLPEGAKLKGTGWATFFWVLASVSLLAVFVVIFMILASLRKSMRDGDVFARVNVLRTRLIGVFLIAGSLFYSLGAWIERKALAPYFAGSAYELNTSFNIMYSDIIMGVLILVVAEIFVIGSSLSEEQKLTI